MEHDGKTLTKEQEAVVRGVCRGWDAKIQAPAGSGKTFVLQVCSKHLGTNGIYIAFNKAIATDAGKKFPRNVNCRTGHSVAYGAVGHKYRHRLGKMTGMMVANAIDIGDWSAYPTQATKGYLLIDTIRRFCYSDDDQIEDYHVPKLKGPYTDEQIPYLRKDLAEKAVPLWEKMIDEKDSFPVTHDMYMKLWALGKPKLRTNFILFDEAQDANPVMLGVVNRQECQRIFVGDKFQQIYGWRGAINAMDVIPVDEELFITQSFRFGQAVADMANNILGSYMHPMDRPPKIVGFDKQQSEVIYTPTEKLPDAIICRTNAGVISQVFQYLGRDIKIYVQGGVNQMVNLLNGARDLQNGKRAWTPDLALFNNWDEVVEFSETESGMDLRSLVMMIKDYGIEKLLEALGSTCNSPEEADITLTTGHKAKGLEWSHVKLHNDFPCPEEGKNLQQGEINLLYVAATRALNLLDVSGCPACHPETLKAAERSFI